jgi:hypothetical protein
MAKMYVAGLTVAAVFVLADRRVDHGEPAGEAGAISALRLVASVQSRYAELNGGYATSLKALATPCTAEQPMMSPNFSSDPAIIGKYEIRLTPDAPNTTGQVDCHGDLTARGYYATAVPRPRIGTGLRTFAIDQNNVIWYDVTGAALKPPFSETDTRKPLR